MKGGIPDNKRVIDPKKGPIKKTAAVGALPEISRTQTKTPTSKSKSKSAGNKVGTDTPRPKSGGAKTGIPKTNSIKIIVTDETETGKITELNIEKKQIPVKEIPDEEIFTKSGMTYASMKNFENSPPPKPEDSKLESKKFTFEETTLKSLTEIDVIEEEEYEDEFEDSDSEFKKDLTVKYHGKEIAEVKPLSRDDEEDAEEIDKEEEKKKKTGSSTDRV